MTPKERDGIGAGLPSPAEIELEPEKVGRERAELLEHGFAAVERR